METVTIKEERALDAAAETFMRYGFAKTTMTDIAGKATMSRPALYLLFPDKEAIFDRVIRRLDAGLLAQIRSKVAGVEELRPKLVIASTVWGLHPTELISAHPDAADLFDLKYPAVRDAYGNFERLIIDMIKDEVDRSDILASAVELARALICSMMGMRECRPTLSTLERQIEVQVDILVRALSCCQ